MPKFTFVHAADLHLGAPFRGLDSESAAAFASRGGSLGNVLSEATFAALARLETLCLENGAAFLLLSGDIYDDRDGVLRARFALRDMFVRLGDAGVRVFIAHGNHDPLQEGPQPVAWPANVTVFGPGVSCACVMREGVPLALVHGISHQTSRERENLAHLFTPYTPETMGAPAFAALPPGVPAGIFQVAVLHCAVGGAGDGHAPYAPCLLTDLTEAGFDYWALGHVHQAKVLCEAPTVAYAGSLQGLHINEAGTHGCLVGRVDEGGLHLGRVPLAPVMWEKVCFDANAFDSVDDLEEALLDALHAAAQTVLDAFPGDAASLARPRPPEWLFCRVTLEGRTSLDRVLRRPGSVSALLDRVRQELAAGYDGTGVAVWLKDIMLETRPEQDAAALVARDDLVGEVVRLAHGAEENPAAAASLVNGALAPLYGHHRLKKFLTGPVGFDTADMANMANSAAMAGLAASAGALLISLLEDE